MGVWVTLTDGKTVSDELALQSSSAVPVTLGDWRGSLVMLEVELIMAIDVAVPVMLSNGKAV